MIKTLQKVGIEGAYLSSKYIHGKSTANIILHDEKCESISSTIRNKVRISTFATFNQSVLEVPATANKEEKNN